MKRYFNEDEARCVDCPEPGNFVGIATAVISSVVFLFCVCTCIFRRPPSCIAWFPRIVRRLTTKIFRLAVMPKIKLVISFYQSVMAVPRIYDVFLPPVYYEWIRPFMLVLNLDWSKWVIPGVCLTSSIAERMAVIALTPIVLMLLEVIIGVLIQIIRGTRASFSLKTYIINTLPVVLLTAFCFVISVSSTVFDAWECVEFEFDSASGTKRSFLLPDLSIECWTDEHRAITNVAWIFVAVWPIGVPVFYTLVLLTTSRAIREKRNTHLSRATAILHQEYEPAYWFWEPVFLLQRLLICGFFGFVSNSSIRLLCAIFITILCARPPRY